MTHAAHGPHERRSRESTHALALAVLATSTALGLSTIAGWQRGGWVIERIAWVSVGSVLVLGAHLLPGLSRSMPIATRWIVGLLWFACMLGAAYGHATFFLLSEQHAGDARAAAVTPPALRALPVPASSAPFPPSRTLTAISADRAKVIAASAVANARRCTGDCSTLIVRRKSLAARVDALDAEADEARRRQVIDDWQLNQIQRATAQRDEARDDPVTTRLAALLNTTAARVDLIAGLALAAVLESVACLCWFVVLRPRHAGATPDMTDSLAIATPHPSSIVASHEPTTGSSVDDSATQEGESEVVRLARDIEAGQLRATVAEIRQYLSCSQAKAIALRRQVVEMLVGP